LSSSGGLSPDGMSFQIFILTASNQIVELTNLSFF
jgi:hypothetical protein